MWGRGHYRISGWSTRDWAVAGFGWCPSEPGEERHLISVNTEPAPRAFRRRPKAPPRLGTRQVREA